MGVAVSVVEVARVGAAELERFWTTLSRTERAEADRVADRRALVSARALVRLALSARVSAVTPADWIFTRDGAGKPHVAGGPCFNLSHTHGLAVCAVHDAPVGVDAEPLAHGSAILDTVVQIFAPPEVATLRALDHQAQLRRAVELWTVKEAYLKGLGTGIGRRLGTFVVTSARQSPRAAGPHVWSVDEDPRWRISVHERADFLIAVATMGNPAIVFRDVLPA